MQLKFQYNKVSLKNIDKQLRIRQNALPILKSKEAALRVHVQGIRSKLKKHQSDLELKKDQINSYAELWNEFRFDLVEIEDLDLETQKVAGVPLYKLKDIVYREIRFAEPSYPAWYTKGIEDLKDVLRLGLSLEIEKENLISLEFARRKTTQKVNLYEKVHIPAYQEAALKIKRYLENEEHISMSAQKILKNRLWNFYTD